MVQVLKLANNPKLRDFCVDFQVWLEVDGFVDIIVSSDEATFHLNGNVKRHNLRFWGMANLHATLKNERAFPPEVNVFCTMTNHSVFGHFFFVTGIT
ncbi:hypothetical protein PR048_003413 [Dryococelus australis]|uniref:Uncharacterized protein n=1 Tax=Dryococelus australis TaxID=614101 RepID=A0ABQ9IMY2_9NEOP|nr:hypothetical protein PR048_003413 [Dryococelus australis]